jgi:YebC/PmpR family DNA-binding regulatory protein
MAKHNKWSKVKHRKAAVEKKRGRVWTKIAKAIIVAAKHGGGDPAANLPLRYAMDEARYANMPRDTVERAIAKGVGGSDTSTYETVRYEGYAPGGIAIIVDALTDNRARTISLVRLAFSDWNGSLGNSGCVGYLFQHRGVITLLGTGLTEDRVMQAALDAGALDVQGPSEAIDPDEESLWTVFTDVPSFIGVRDALEKAKFPISEATLSLVPDTLVTVSGEAAKDVEGLIEALEEIDDVQKVFSNADIEGE